ncbi:MAG: general stress protein [Thermomicrobiales bacterium]
MTAADIQAGTKRTVVGTFDGPHDAEMALNDLKDGGFTPQQVSVIAKDNKDTKAMVENTGMGGEGVGTGVGVGGITGGIIGWLVGVSALVIPGIGPIVGAGILASTLVGAGVGAVAGGIVGALVEAGVPEEDARGYETSVKEGRILLLVQAQTDEQAQRAYNIFSQHGGADIRHYGTTSDITAGTQYPQYTSDRPAVEP